jgi:hypothetical protein
MPGFAVERRKKSVKKLSQTIAVEKSSKSRAFKVLTEAHKLLGKTEPLVGISRTYQPADEEGEKYPDERGRVQVTDESVIDDVEDALTVMFDDVATNYWGNCNAKADVVIGTQTILADVPVTYLLFLEKQLIDLHTFVQKLPTLDPSETWETGETTDGLYKTTTVETTKTKKVPRNHVKAEATKEHPAQVDVYYEDIVVGHWKTTKFSGAIPAGRARLYLDRVEELQRAVKQARELANSIEVEELKVGSQILDHIFYVEEPAVPR